MFSCFSPSVEDSMLSSSSSQKCKLYTYYLPELKKSTNLLINKPTSSSTNKNTERSEEKDIINKISEIKERGNFSFKTGNYSAALTEYSKGLSFFCSQRTQPDYNDLRLSFLKNIDNNASSPYSSSPSCSPTSQEGIVSSSLSKILMKKDEHGEGQHDNQIEKNQDEENLILLTNLLSNRSASFFNEKQYQEALHDAEQVVQLRPSWAKGHFRKAETLIKLRDFHKAYLSYEKAVENDPTNVLITGRLWKCKYAKKDFDRGFVIHQLLPGRHLCQKSWFSPIQNLLFDFAIQMRNFIYIIENTTSHECIVVDACWDIDGILEYIKNQKLTLVGAVITHYHVDHCGGKPPPPYDKYPVRVDGIFKLLKKVPGIFAYIHEEDIPGTLNANPELSTDRIKPVQDGFKLTLPLYHSPNSDTNDTIPDSSLRTSAQASGNNPRPTPIQFIHTPGHTPGSQCLLINNDRLLSGDTLFIDTCGRLDFPDSDKQRMNSSLGEKLFSLNDDIVVFPGHDYGGEFTTIGREKHHGVLKAFKERNENQIENLLNMLSGSPPR